MKRKILGLLLIVAIAIGACKKNNNDGLTPETQTGANTFSCKINGEIFVPQQALFGPAPLSAIIDDFNGEKILRIDVYSGDEIAKRFNINIKHFEGSKRYSMNYSISDTYAQYIYRYNLPNKTIYSSKQTNNGFVNITKYDGKIVSGTFEFLLNNESDGAEIARVTFGRFDIQTR